MSRTRAPRGFLECRSRWRTVIKAQLKAQTQRQFKFKVLPALAVAQVAVIEDREKSDRCSGHQPNTNELRLWGSAGQVSVAHPLFSKSQGAAVFLQHKPVTTLHVGLQSRKLGVGLDSCPLAHWESYNTLRAGLDQQPPPPRAQHP